MVLEWLLYGLGTIGLLAGSYSDLRTREVPDWVSYSLIFSGLGIRLIFSLAGFEWEIFFEGLVGFLIFVILAYLFYYLGQWGGGDAKLLMGLGAIIGFSFDFGSFPKLLTFLIHLALIGSVYGVGWLIVLAFKNKEKFKLEFKRQQGQFSILGIGFLALGIGLIVGSFYFPGVWRSLMLLWAIMPIGSLYVWMLVSSVEKIAFYKHVRPEDLTEGDWIAKNVVVGGEKICGPRDLGINEEQIAKLVELKQKGKIQKILIKEGIPFVPSFLIAFAVTIIFGAWWMGFIL
ncbi:MAG: prepilin peptidase [Nanoarchaeota archaeon]|nr:prepilin peptidase [Nanoarchaeota archaeon]